MQTSINVLASPFMAGVGNRKKEHGFSHYFVAWAKALAFNSF
jgi:hypothetical protein